MIKGVTEEEISIIRELLKPYKEEYTFYFYGSRVKGKFEKASDLDILIKGEKEMPLDKILNLKLVFDNSNLPYVVNFADYNNLTMEFYEYIKNDLVEVYQ